MRDEDALRKLMLQKTRGIVLHTTDFGETSLVVRIYTEAFGLRSYIVNSVRKKNPKIHPTVFQPLTLVEAVVYHKDKPGLQRLSDVRPDPLLRSIRGDMTKVSMAIFINEVLNKSIREEEANPGLFEFLFHSIQMLDIQQPLVRGFHLFFMIRLSRFLGFSPSMNYGSEGEVFDLKDGLFRSSIPGHPYYLSGETAEAFHRLVIQSGDYSAELELPTAKMRELLSGVIEYYRLHIEGMSELKSMRVLEQVWS